MSHQHRDAMPHGGVRVEPTVRLWREVEERLKWLALATNFMGPHDVTPYDEFLLRLLAEYPVQ